MSQTERLYKLKHFLDAGRCLTKAFLLEELGISPATLKRDIAYLRDRMNAPSSSTRSAAAGGSTRTSKPSARSTNCPAYGSAPRRFMPC